MVVIPFAIYIAVQIMLLPLGIIGALLVTYRQLRVSQRLGLSQTAVEVLNGRWTMDVFGIRQDTAARKLARVLPNDSIAGLWLALFPLYLLYRMTRRNYIYPRVPREGRESIADLVIVRTLYFDTLIAARLAAAEQFVILGAGLDTRFYGALLEGSGLTMFEVDQANTQRMKRTRLHQAGLPTERVRFIEVDFTEAGWTKGLLDAGFNPAAKTFFLWEGVTLYLDEADVVATLGALRTIAAKGSVVFTDIYAERFLSIGRKRGLAKTLEITDEELRFGLDFTKDHDRILRQFVQAQDLRMGHAKFLGASAGSGPYAVVAELLL